MPVDVISDQFAYRPTGSTNSALVFLMHHVTKMLENNAYVRCLMIDFSKAFDVIDHCLLLSKILKLSLPPNIFNWLISFLTNRFIVLKSGGFFSLPKQINRSIVQGSRLGPYLYIIFAGDLKLLSFI